MTKAARVKRDAEIDQMLEEGWSVAIVAETVGLTERTIYSRKAALHKAAIESDPLLAELAELESQYPIPELPPLGGVLDVLEAMLYGGPGAALPELAELEAILSPTPVVAPVVEAFPRGDDGDAGPTPESLVN